ncbi:MAG: TfoX/Sxy family DNA transformation protein [Bryobacterales bacterium]|nr:TfoX/Sxy family DNA transformation protein [Bryobacterales bacterium]
MSTAIEKARNLGPVMGAELRPLGIDTLEALREVGWQEAWDRLCDRYPVRTHLLCGYALLGAEMDLDCMKLPDALKVKVKAHKRARQSMRAR